MLAFPFTPFQIIESASIPETLPPLNEPPTHGHDILVEEAAQASRQDQFKSGLTGIRALAALMVLAFHVFAMAGPRALSLHLGDLEIPYHWLITCSWMGANIFFVLSGFLLAIPFSQQVEGQRGSIAVRAYLLRRIRRVIPAYWLQIVILCVVAYFTASLPSWRVIAAQFLFLQNFWPGFSEALNAVYWTLPVEFGYYLLLPVFAAIVGVFASSKRIAWLTASVLLIIAAIVYRTLMYAVVADEPQQIKFFMLMQLPGLIDHFAIGMLLAWVHVRHGRSIKPWMSNLMVATGLLGIVFMMLMVELNFRTYWEGNAMLLYGYSITAIFIGVVVLGTATGGRLSRILFANSSMLFVGIISYSLYLWHYPILIWTQKLLDYFSIGGDRLWWLIAIGVPLSLLAAMISYALVERPFLAHRRPAGN